MLAGFMGLLECQTAIIEPRISYQKSPKAANLGLKIWALSGYSGPKVNDFFKLTSIGCSLMSWQGAIFDPMHVAPLLSDERNQPHC